MFSSLKKNVNFELNFKFIENDCFYLICIFNILLFNNMDFLDNMNEEENTDFLYMEGNLVYYYYYD